MILDLLLVTALGFLGSFGHCAGMCGPLTLAFSLNSGSTVSRNGWQQLRFHSLLNLGRLISYVLVGAVIGGIGSVLLASGHMAGVGSPLRQAIAWLTGGLLIWFGLRQVRPDWLPRIPLLHPFAQGKRHQQLSAIALYWSRQTHWWAPLLLGLVWGLMPCGFLYAAHIKAAETGTWWLGGATMLAFGSGTVPVMLGVGVSASRLSADRRTQLSRLGGWLTVLIGMLTLLRTGNMVDYTGHLGLACLILALVARPLSRLWSFPLQYRRVLGVSAFVLALLHTAHVLEHSLDWNLFAIGFMLPIHRWGIGAGALALLLLIPAALTSSDRMMQLLGKHWRSLHLLTVPAFLLGTMHMVLVGSRYLGGLEWSATNQVQTGMWGAIAIGVLLVRSRWIWSLLALERFYVPPSESKSGPKLDCAAHSNRCASTGSHRQDG